MLCVLIVYSVCYASAQQQYVLYYPLPSFMKRALCFSGPWINHTFHPSILSFIMHSLLSVSKYNHPYDGVREWTDETMAASFFFHSETLALLSWLAPLPSPLPPPSFPFLCSYPIQRLLFISLQSSQSSQNRKPANQRGTTTTEVVLLPFSLCMWREGLSNTASFLSLQAHCYSLFC